MEYSLGIDIGKKGALVILKKDKDLLSVFSAIPMPLLKDGSLNLLKIIEYITYFKRDLEGKEICMEKIVPIYGISKTSYGELKFQEGIIKALCACQDIEVNQIVSKQWQEYTFKGIKEITKNNSKKRDTKKMALKAVELYFPDQKLTFTERQKIAHDGLVDAILICRYNVINKNIINKH